MNNKIFLFICLTIITGLFLFVGGVIFDEHPLTNMIAWFIITGILFLICITGLIYNVYLQTISETDLLETQIHELEI